GPNLSRKPAVARKTPPARPTSSPITITDGSRSSSTWNASLMASTIESSAKRPPQLFEVGAERRRRIDVCVLEQKRDVGGRASVRSCDPRTNRVGGFGADRLGEVLVHDPRASQIALEAADALALLLVLDALEIDVRTRIVRGRVRGGAIRERLDERRSLAGAGARNRLARRLVDGERVRPVHPNPGHPVADCLVSERLRARLCLERRRDRPLAVVAEQDQRRGRDGGEVRAFVERALRGRAVAEEDDGAGALALHLLPPGEPGCVWHVRADRDADRRDVVVLRVPPAGRMA